MTSRFPRASDEPERTSRTWTAPDGKRYRVVLEQAPRHRVRAGDRRPVLTFVPLDPPGPQVVRVVREGFDLAHADDLVLFTTLRQEGS